MADRPSVPTRSLPPGSVGRAGPWTRGLVEERRDAHPDRDARPRHPLCERRRRQADRAETLQPPFPLRLDHLALRGAPDAVALTVGEASLTYAEFEDAVGRNAAELLAQRIALALLCLVAAKLAGLSVPMVLKHLVDGLNLPATKESMVLVLPSGSRVRAVWAEVHLARQTSAGTASAIDACLHLVRGRLGAAAANRRPRRPGGLVPAQLLVDGQALGEGEGYLSIVPP